MKQSSKKSRKSNLPSLVGKDVLQPVDINSIGSNGDPCFGKAYDLSTDECKQCGDSELCCIKFAAALGKTREELEASNNYKDMEVMIDKVAIRKTIRTLKRREYGKKEIIAKIQTKYELPYEEAKAIYKELTIKKK